MASPHEPKTETVRIGLPLPGAGKSPDQKVQETVRIQLPVGEPQARPLSFSPQLSASVMPAPDSPSLGPKKETTRVPLMPSPFPSAARIKDTQSVVAVPSVASQNSLIAMGRREKNRMLLWWILLLGSALILIIQIWTYLS
jgi:hypothetical protein